MDDSSSALLSGLLNPLPAAQVAGLRQLPGFGGGTMPPGSSFRASGAKSVLKGVGQPRKSSTQVGPKFSKPAARSKELEMMDTTFDVKQVVDNVGRFTSFQAK